MKNEKKIVLSLVVLLVAVALIVGLTYAIWQITLQQKRKNVISTGCFEVEFTSVNGSAAINLGDAYPMSEEDGMKLVPYEFVIKNKCNDKASYVLNLETVTNVTSEASANENETTSTEVLTDENETTPTETIKALSDIYIKVGIKGESIPGESHTKIYSLSDEKIINSAKVIVEASKAYKLLDGELGPKEEQTYELRLWMDEDTPAIDDVMNATYKGKLTLSSVFVPEEVNSRVMIAMNVTDNCAVENATDDCVVTNNTYTKNGTYTLNKVVFEKELNPKTTSEPVVDFSVSQNKSVLGYYVLDETDDTKYTLYIQANGKIKVNENASYYISSNNTLFEGIENLDTRNVTNMSKMFYLNIDGFTNLDLSHFDTSKVTNMSNMFEGRNGSSLTNINFYGWETKNVTNMSGMFANLKNITTLDLSEFNTINVTDMNSMFKNSSLTNIEYGSKFVHKTDAVFTDMYANCSANKPTSTSWNDVFPSDTED